jgi:phage terminase large subunit-like protein
LIVHVTTADFARPSVCNEKYDYACKVRDGVLQDASFLPVIYEAPKVWEGQPADYTNPALYSNRKLWHLVNPNLGVSLGLDYMARECQRAQETPSYLNTFLRLHLNVQTAADVAHYDMTQWEACADATLTPEALLGHPCWAGLDLASTSDLCALVLLFPEDDNAILAYFWLPQETALVRERRHRVPYCHLTHKTAIFDA